MMVPGNQLPRWCERETLTGSLFLSLGVAFDSDKNRIGHGKGYYDRYLLKYQDWATRNNKPMVKTGNTHSIWYDLKG
jgi:5-formyltetrahydrofolate cyclo-ligase